MKWRTAILSPILLNILFHHCCTICAPSILQILFEKTTDPGKLADHQGSSVQVCSLFVSELALITTWLQKKELKILLSWKKKKLGKVGLVFEKLPQVFMTITLVFSEFGIDNLILTLFEEF